MSKPNPCHRQEITLHKEPNKFLAMEEEVATIADRNPDPIIHYVPRRSLFDGVEAPAGYVSLVFRGGNTVLMFKEELVWTTTTTALESTFIRRFRTKVSSWSSTKYTNLTRLVGAWVGQLKEIPKSTYSTVKRLLKCKRKSKNSRSN